MPSTKKILYYLITVLVILTAVGLAGWYFFLNKQKQAITESDTGRGLDSAPPTFGGSIGSTYSNVTGSDSSATREGQAKTPPRLWKVTKTPVAGMRFVGDKNSSSAPATTTNAQLYFAERGTGYILKADPKTGDVTRLTNKLIPRIYEAVFGSDGAVVLRSINEEGRITSFAGEAPEQTVSASSSTQNKLSGGVAALSGNYLEPDILAVVPKPEARELFLLVPRVDGGSSVVLSSWDGKKQKNLFTSPLSEWRLFPLSDGRIFLSLLPSDDVAGFAFEIKNGVLVPRLRDIPGLTFLPRASSNAVLFGQSGGEDVSLFYSPKEGSGAEYLPIKTVADKCVWAPSLNAPRSGASAKASGSPDGTFRGEHSAKQNVLASEQLIAYCAVPQYFISKTFLSDWYRGAVHTSDNWWRIDATNGQVTPLLESGETDQSFDVENPTIDSAGENIAFMNAIDKSLWLLQINASPK